MPVETQIAFTDGVAFVFIISSLLTVPAIIVSAMEGRDDVKIKNYLIFL